MNGRTKITASAEYEKALGIMESEKGDSKEATDLLHVALNLGDPRAAYALGTWYLVGANGLQEDRKKGIELISLAADGKVPAALFDLAACYEEGLSVEVDSRKAFLMYLDAAVRGDQQAVFEVSRCYFHGIGVEQDLQIAQIWGDRAEELGTFRV